MPLPSNVSYGTVVGTFLTATADSPDDVDRDPQGVAATDLKFRFSPDLNTPVARDATATPPVMFALQDINATVGTDGSLLGPDNAPGVKLVASTNSALQPNGWTWKVTLSGAGFPAMSWSFLLDPGATIDLATVLPIPANPGATLNAWLQAVADATAARDAAQAAAASVPSAASLAATYLPLPIPALEGVPLTVYGDSYGQGGQGADQASRPFNRLAVRHRTQAATIRAVAGTRMDEIAAAVASSWSGNTRGLVGLADGCINDEKQYGDNTGIPTTREAFRTALAYLSAQAVLALTDAGLMFGPGWSGGVSSTAGSYVDIGWTGDAVYVLLGFGAGGGIATISNAGATVTTATTNGYLKSFTGAVKIAGFGAGNHTVRLSVTSGTITLIGAAVQSSTPALIAWDKPGQLNSNTGETSRLAAYLAACAAIAGDFPNLLPVDMGSGWDYTTMISSDNTHRNDLGNRYATDVIDAALRARIGTAYVQGLNALNYVSAGPTYTSPTPAYATSGATAPNAPTGLGITQADTSAAATWTRPNDGGATITGYQIRTRTPQGSGTWVTASVSIPPSATSATVTGLTASTAYDLQVVAINSVGTGTYSSSASFSTTVPVVVYADDTFTRADSSTPGTVETGGLSWATTTGAAYSIASGQLKSTTIANPADCYVDTGQANGSVRVTGYVNACGLVFRASASNDATGYVFYRNALVYSLKKRTAANAYTSIQDTTGITPSAGDVLRVVLNGSTITCYVNGVQVISVTDSTYTGTRHGVWSQNAASTFDNFRADSALS